MHEPPSKGMPLKPESRIVLRTLPLLLLLSFGCGSPDDTPADPGWINANLRLNDIQVVGSHNSYKPGIDPGLLTLIGEGNPGQAEGLDYGHLSLRDQLDLGLRNLELDVFYDPDGGRYAVPKGLDVIRAAGLRDSGVYDLEGEMEQPGFKVLHMQDIDFRSHCLTLRSCLTQIKAWSNRHPDHLPIIITVNAKDGTIDRPDFTVPLPFDSLAFARLDQEILDVLPIEVLIRPDDVRGSYSTLEEAVLAGNWPLLRDARGKMLFVLDESGEKLEHYRRGHPSLSGRVFFGNAAAGSPEAAVLIMNDPARDGERIQEMVRLGYLVRTRADEDTREARSGDISRREAAFASGAQVVTTDYYVEDLRFQTGYSVELPGGGVARCNPIRAPKACRDEAIIEE